MLIRNNKGEVVGENEYVDYPGRRRYQHKHALRQRKSRHSEHLHPRQSRQGPHDECDRRKDFALIEASGS